MSVLTPQPMSTLTFQWDPKNLEIKTKSVEKTLEPLVTQVTTLVSQKGPGNGKKGRSKKAKVLSAAVAKAIDHFINEGQKIAEENVEIRNEMFSAVEEVKKTGDTMKSASDDFAGDPCSSMKRGTMVRAARALLGAVTRLLILADMVDVNNLLRALRTVQSDLDRVRDASSEKELRSAFKDFGTGVMALSERAGRRQLDLKDPYNREKMASARAMLKTNTLPLLTASKVYVRHPELAAARANRDYVLRQVCDAVDQISGVAQSKGMDGHPFDGPGELANALDEFDIRIMDPDSGKGGRRQGPSLEERLESIISGAALMADSSCTRDERRDRIVEECNAVRQALQDLLTETMKNMGSSERSGNMTRAIDQVCSRTTDLRKQLRRAVVDHVSDTFFDTSGPLFDLIDAAKAGKVEEVENEYGRRFTDHASKMVEVANLACSMSNNEEGVKFVRLAASNIENLYPQVLNAARILALRPDSKVALENMDVFKDSWLKQTRLLTDAIDDIVLIEDFLSVSENHILEDVKACVQALDAGNIDALHDSGRKLIGRSQRISDVVGVEMEKYQPGPYTERVLQSVVLLRDKSIPNFINNLRYVLDKMEANPSTQFSPDDKDAFINSAGLIYDGVKEIRQAALFNRGDDYDQSMSEMDGTNPYGSYYDYGTGSMDRRSDNGGIIVAQDDVQKEHIDDSSDRAKMRMVIDQMPEEQRAHFDQQVAHFFVERKRFEREVAKWDDSGNEIIVLAKQMCMIMMEMTDFTRGRGPLKNTMDVINAAKKISEAGSNLDKLCKEIVQHCPESASKKDLLAYLQRIALYCHQLNITSKVKADVQNISGELIVSGLDSATSLIQAAKNLMNAVVLSVKASYVASTKYKSGSKNLQVTWKMRAPDKKPLVRPDDSVEVRGRIRRSEKHQKMEPVHELSKFTDA